MKRLSLVLLVVGLTVAARAATGSYIVPGTADPWLANASIDNIPTPEPPDTAPGQSPVDAGPVTPGEWVFWGASGEVGHPGDISGPNGASPVSRYMGGNNGIPDLTAPICSLIGVWAYPGGGIPFFMGTSGSLQVPAGVSELFLGTMDGYGWANNYGSFKVDIRTASSAPDGGSSLLLLGLSGLGLLGFYRKQGVA